jgi:hypothetical protein
MLNDRGIGLDLLNYSYGSAVPIRRREQRTVDGSLA